MSLYLVNPGICHEEAIIGFADEFRERKEKICGSCGLAWYGDVSQWLERLHNVESGLAPDRVPSSTYLAIDKGSGLIIGITDIRHYLNEEHFNSGHIGYYVRPSQRRKGYGTRLLALGLNKARGLNIPRALLTCGKHNAASKRVTEKNGGKFEMEFIGGGEAYLAYWISLAD